jgi:hypothetical protein
VGPRRLHREVVTPAVILAEVYPGPGHNQVVDACLIRETGIDVRTTDVEAGGGVIITGDASDVERPAAPYPGVLVKAI